MADEGRTQHPRYRLVHLGTLGGPIGYGSVSGDGIRMLNHKGEVTSFADTAVPDPMQEEVLTKEAKEMFESLIPRGKMGRSEEIATVALFLASYDSSFVNGVELFVDGGFSAI